MKIMSALYYSQHIICWWHRPTPNAWFEISGLVGSGVLGVLVPKDEDRALLLNFNLSLWFSA